jgi:hypothetical protein
MTARIKTFTSIIRSLFVLLFFACTPENNGNNSLAGNQIELPKWTWPLIQSTAFKEKYTFDLRINPFYLQADFDKNGFGDMAILIKERTSGKTGVALLLQGKSQLKILGAGQVASFGGEDWNWLRTWKTETILPAGAGVQPVGAVLILFPSDINQEAPWLFWNGQDWQWKND